MRYRLHIILVVAQMFLAGMAFSQSVTATCGGNSNGGYGSFSYSFGQTFYNVLGYNITFTEGVQQPFEISEYGDDDEGKFGNEFLRDISLSAFPNPASNYLYLNIGDDEDLADVALEYVMYDAEGRPIMQDRINVGENLLDVQQLVPSTYFVRVMLDGRKVKTFKVIKN